MHYRGYTLRLALAIALTGAMIGSAAAQAKRIGQYKDWMAFVDGSGKSKTCYIGSQPVKSQGKYTKRDPTHVYVSHRPADKAVGEITIEAGYTYKPGSEVRATVDGKSFKLFTQGGNAWTYEATSDSAMVRAMKAGRRMVVKGTSSRGTLTTDTYSLLGFTAAYNAITKACR